jgi:formate hydrogenlyase subunit 3/multisubunit Na+/H+ antiporter MnhD subunit
MSFFQKKKYNLAYFYALISIYMISIIFFFYSESYVHFFVLFELITFASVFLMTIQQKQSLELSKINNNVGLRYLIVCSFATVVMLLSVLILYQKTSSLVYIEINKSLFYSKEDLDHFVPVVLLLLIGIFVKAGVAPFQT